MAKGDLDPKYYIQDSETARARGSVGGKRSGEKKRENRKMKEIAELILTLPLSSGKSKLIDQIKSLDEVDTANLSTGTAILLAQVKRALQGNTAAFIAVRDTSGNKPVEEVNLFPEEVLPIIVNDISERPAGHRGVCFIDNIKDRHEDD